MPPEEPNEILFEINDEEYNELFNEDDISFKRLPSQILRQDISQINFSSIKQGSIGDCYFLAALGTILQREPQLIDDIITIRNDGRVDVRFHHADNPEQVFTYRITPSKVRFDQNTQNSLFGFFSKSDYGSRHTNSIIYILEKAYALHRKIRYRPTLSEDENTLLSLHERYNGDEELACVKFMTIKKQQNENVTYEKALEMLEDGIKKIEEYSTYKGALNGGFPDDVYTDLLGCSATRLNVVFLDYEYLLTEFPAEALMYMGSGTLSEELSYVLEGMFGSIDTDECQEFLEKLQENPSFFIQSLQLFNDLKHRPSPRESVHEELKTFFANAFEGLSSNTLDKIFDFIDEEIPYKRGLSRYTSKEIDLFNLVEQKIQEGELVSLSTHKMVGRGEDTQERIYAGEPKFRGMAGRHAYQVLDCYERDGRKLFLVRNPWSEYVRNYTLREDGQTLATSKDTHHSRAIWESEPLISQTQTGIEEDSVKKYKKSGGVFELELNDVYKRCNSVYFTENFNDLIEESTLTKKSS
ncbi:hypothetical protein E3983_03445 [Legionella israelensis]|uniref:Calpain catalytic domain-containing protein n=1 Tax=Legionella israelensis TaxID=454 RepID=A0AAX1EEF6_9GAMM|nr:C2 family cysteine protease [Legionella israelensis]QBR83500.1 hypothetical protein E3983_03445 [Legionella israelensis]